MTEISHPVNITGSSRQSAQRLERVDQYTDVSCFFELDWRSQNATHTDCHFQQRLNFWQDYFPPELEASMSGKSCGDSATILFEPGRLVPGYENRLCIRSSHDIFAQHSAKAGFNPARFGRYYPKRFIAGSHGIYEQDVTPMRVTGIDTELCLDLNHPLTNFDLSLTARIVNIGNSPRHDDASQDIRELATLNGPGMQARWNSQPTDFWSDNPFERVDERPDADFYQNPRLVNHIDSCASGQISDLYRRLLRKGNAVLDLMASWNSHLPEDLELAEVVGLGLNRDELEKNPELDKYVLHDLNQNPVLSFESEKFDAVICTVSVEYLTRPLEVFREIYRVLNPGGLFIVTFSNRWFPPKAIGIWAQLHDYERMGLVLEYFLLGNGFEDLHTWSIRGLPRPEDDKYADRLLVSDPVYAVWGAKQAG